MLGASKKGEHLKELILKVLKWVKKNIEKHQDTIPMTESMHP